MVRGESFSNSYQTPRHAIPNNTILADMVEIYIYKYTYCSGDTNEMLCYVIDLS